MTSTHFSVSRKVTASGVVWLNGRSYYVSRRLAGQVIPLRIVGGRLIIDVAVPLHKVYRLPNKSGTPGAAPAAQPADTSSPPRPLQGRPRAAEPPAHEPCLLTEARR